jgi:hypothetical protein
MSADSSDMDILAEGVPDEGDPDKTIIDGSEDTRNDESGEETTGDTDSEGEQEDDGEKESEVDENLDDPSLFKKLKAKHPEIFKEFPELRKEIALAQQITTVFPNVEAAKEAQETIAGFELIREAALAGDPKTILEEIARADENAAVKFAVDFVPMLEKNAPALYNQVATPIVKNILRAIAQEAKANGNQDLYYSVGHISKRIFNSPNIPDDIAPPPEILQKQTELEKKQKDFESSKQSYFENGISVSAEKRLTAAISNGLDPENTMSPKMRDAIAADTAKEIKDVLRSDKRYLATMNSLFKSAADNGFSPEASEKIINTFLARVKPLINPARQKIRSEYLQEKRNKNEINKSQKKFIPTSGNSGSSTKSLDPRNIDYRRTSDADILSGKINYKGK